MNIINDFIKISQYAGMREDIVQAGDGNTSCKTDKTKMLIKSSGYMLSDITECSGYSTVDYAAIKLFLQKTITGLFLKKRV